MKKKFAFVLMGEDYSPEEHRACFETENMMTYIYTVQNFEQAKERVVCLQKQGFGAVELCGAFGREHAIELIELTGHQMVIGYVVDEPEQQELVKNFFA